MQDIRHMDGKLSKRLTVLIVDDEPYIRLTAADIIQDAGHQTVEAEDADKALSILQHRMDIDVVFTDIKMPGSMDGLKLAAEIRSRWPTLHILITSGHVLGPDLGEDTPFLPKPYRMTALMGHLAQFAQ